LKNIVIEDEKKVGEAQTSLRLIQIAACDKMLSSASNERIQLENLIANFEKWERNKIKNEIKKRKKRINRSNSNKS
jgi:hypothetical protein